MILITEYSQYVLAVFAVDIVKCRLLFLYKCFNAFRFFYINVFNAFRGNRFVYSILFPLKTAEDRAFYSIFQELI